MKKKILALCLVVVLAVTAVTGVTLAYFTDTDSAVNVMVSGGVSIIQNEQQRTADNATEKTLEAFEDGKPLFPITGDTNDDGMMDGDYTEDILGYTFVDQNGDEQTIVSPENTKGGRTSVFPMSKNVVDKIVTVTNDGQSEAYVRTLFAFEIPTVDYAKKVYGEEDYANLLKDNYFGLLNEKYIDVVNVDHYLRTVWHQGKTEGKAEILPKDNGEYVVIEGKDVAYMVAVYYYKNDSKLAVDETSHPSLKQLYMDATATNEDAQLLVGGDGEYNLIALTQAVQTTGFTSPEEALNEAFGEITIANATEWFGLVPATLLP